MAEGLDEARRKLDDEYGRRRDMTEADVDALLARCREELAKVKVPVAVHVLEALPKNPVGKIDKPALRALLAKES